MGPPKVSTRLSGGVAEVDGLALPNGLSVARLPRFVVELWAVIHSRSGMAVAAYFPGEETAGAAAAELGKYLDWTMYGEDIQELGYEHPWVAARDEICERLGASLSSEESRTLQEEDKLIPATDI